MSLLEKNMALATAEASAGDHILSRWEKAKGTGVLGYESVCLKCGQTIYASAFTINSLLDPECPVATPAVDSENQGSFKDASG